MRKRLVALAAVTLLVCLISITASAQNPNYGVEVDCEDTQIELEADPTNIVEGYLDCTITNPSVHLEKIYYDFRTNSAAMSSPNSGYITLNGGESEILEIWDPKNLHRGVRPVCCLYPAGWARSSFWHAVS